MNASQRTNPSLAATSVVHPSDLVARAIRLAGSRLRNVAHLERRVSSEAVTVTAAVDDLSRSLSELLVAAGGRLDAPRQGESRWVRVVAEVAAGGLELAVEHGAAKDARTTIRVPLADPMARSA